jgi:hypothetical protein
MGLSGLSSRLRRDFPGYPRYGRDPHIVSHQCRQLIMRWLLRSHCRQLDSSNLANLAGCSGTLIPYAIFPINSIRFAAFWRPCSLSGKALDIFQRQPGQSFAFVNASMDLNQLHIPYRGIALPMSYCEPTTMCCPCCFNSVSRTKIQHTASLLRC